MRHQRAADPCEPARDGEGKGAVGAQVHARGLGQLVLPVDGVEGQADGAFLDPPEDPEAEDHDSAGEVVIADRFEEIEIVDADREVGHRVDPLDALGPAEGFAEAFPEQADDFARREAADEEVEALHAEEREAEQDGDERRRDAAQQHRDGHEDAEFLGVERAGIGADAHDHHVPERPFAGQREQAIGADQKHVDGQEDEDFLLREAEPVGEQDEGDKGDGPEEVFKHGPHSRTGRSA